MFIGMVRNTPSYSFHVLLGRLQLLSKITFGLKVLFIHVQKLKFMMYFGERRLSSLFLYVHVL